MPIHKHNNNDDFDDFPKISYHYPKLSEESLPVTTFPNIFRKFPKIAEDFRRRFDHIILDVVAFVFFLKLLVFAVKHFLYPRIASAELLKLDLMLV